MASCAIALLPSGAAQASTAFTDKQLDTRVSDAVANGSDAVKVLVEESGTDYRLANAILRQAEVTTETETGEESSFLDSCHGPVSSRTTIGLAGVNIGWRKAKVNQWCWNSSSLTSADVDSDTWSGFGFCWKDEHNSKSWLIYPKRQKYVSKGTLAGIGPWGCTGAQQTISPNVHYERGGGYNNYGSD